MTVIKNKEQLRKLGIMEISFTELKTNFKKLIGQAKNKEELELLFESLYLSLKHRREGIRPPPNFRSWFKFKK